MDKAICKYCGETKDACLFIKDKKLFRCRKCYNSKYGSGTFDDNEFLNKHGYKPKHSKAETKRTKPRYSELQADVAKYKALYENSQSQVDTLKKILSLISKDLKVNISAIDHALEEPEKDISLQYADFLENELPDIVKDIIDVINTHTNED